MFLSASCLTTLSGATPSTFSANVGTRCSSTADHKSLCQDRVQAIGKLNSQFELKVLGTAISVCKLSEVFT
jgi:hypothetical protein